jgi:hypothetical protein
VLNQLNIKIKREPGLDMSEKEAPSRVQTPELGPADGSKDDSVEKPWKALRAEKKSPIADASASAKAQQLPPREAPEQCEQLP